ncbi:isopentenyl-diphosphate Delta-isomerase [Corynebacterium sp. HMSC074A01]|uniref:isopentenyl-diphosphate Delta-isomerase n=1 Tax=Corynebacterium sp. HMSC074A01 TaxID=1715030 RepID=UPI0008A43179|nr:isopentenyl-diphosphate Delta-isomerase [Corynebacterium sp. HMSC074A01]OHF36824.1 isopentenyl-diphosphate delta-isomerase [Corynebacterium sp. HMSC074A01]
MREQVVLIDATGTPIGAADKTDVHTDSTPLHLAFSCWLLDADGRLLLTRRALGKLTWPGVWTNSFCGHPAPGEAAVDAVRRRAAEELGMPAIDAITEVLPDFRYRAVDSSGVVENEVCPVFTARMSPGVELDPNPDEVDSWAWVAPQDVIRAAEATPFAFSPWLVEELADERLRNAL